MQAALIHPPDAPAPLSAAGEEDGPQVPAWLQ